jgi:hypothetical protein
VIISLNVRNILRVQYADNGGLTFLPEPVMSSVLVPVLAQLAVNSNTPLPPPKRYA